jgi:hypothetical protein
MSADNYVADTYAAEALAIAKAYRPLTDEEKRLTSAKMGRIKVVIKSTWDLRYFQWVEIYAHLYEETMKDMTAYEKEIYLLKRWEELLKETLGAVEVEQEPTEEELRYALEMYH